VAQAGTTGQTTTSRTTSLILWTQGRLARLIPPKSAHHYGASGWRGGWSIGCGSWSSSLVECLLWWLTDRLTPRGHQAA